MSQLESQPAEGLMDRAFPELEWKSILSNKVGTVYLQRLCLSLGVDYESPSKKTTLIAQLAPLLAERHFTPQKVLQILKLQSWIDISASGFQAPLITPPASAAGRALHCSAGDPGFDPGRARSPFFRLRVVSSPLMGMEPTGLGSPDEPEVSSGATSVSRGLFTPPSQEPLAPALPSHSKEPEDHPPSPGTRGEDIETLLEPNAPDDVLDDILWQVPADWYCSGHRPLATPEPPPSPQRRIPAGVTNDDGQSCAYAATVQLLAGLRLRAPGPVEASLRGTPVLEPGPLRVDKCSCGGQLRELSAVKPAPVLVVTVDKLAGVIAPSASSGAEAHWLPTTGHETAIFRTNDGALFDLSGTRRTEVTTSDVEEGLRLLVLWWRGCHHRRNDSQGGPWAAAPAPTPSRLTTKRHCPPRLLHPPQQHHRPRQHGPAGRPREQLLAPPVDRPASPADVSPSPSDQATTNTPEEEHQDHTGAPLNHNRPRSSGTS
ncbi:hypothetical protein PAPYR_5814 [Paratrimastix pyriformis]|uniref:Uncharacterized protein n=1 Tax=Paratrimastix pyriformis TaxID=342808 RepID=A0ABQ8UGP9_9EUKA|nr:hypothetical protein PAPYR_5814 [Paratrimastix pyriformis]